MSDTTNGINGADTLAMVREECRKHKGTCVGCTYCDKANGNCKVLIVPEHWEFAGEEDDHDD